MEQPEQRRCFSNNYVQAIHRYANMILLLLIAALAWWLVGIDGRVSKEGDARQLLSQEQSRVKAQNEEVLRRLEMMSQQLVVIDNRVYLLFGARVKGEILP